MGEPGSPQGSSSLPKALRIGVLALQGSFREHIAALRRCALHPLLQSQQYVLEVVEVRRTEQLQGLQGLIVPGGESTTMAHVAERNGMIPALKEYEASGSPIWGTCAGLIFLADRALGQKMGGQALLGGLDCTVHRNFFGSQINSFETDLPAPPEFGALQGTSEGQHGTSGAEQEALSEGNGTPGRSNGAPFRAVFIRAPAIVETGPTVEVLSEYTVKKARHDPGTPQSAEQQELDKLDKVAVAVKQGQLLATAFHPELTADNRWHLFFLSMVLDHLKTHGTSDSSAHGSTALERKKLSNDPGLLPVFSSAGTLKIELKH